MGFELTKKQHEIVNFIEGPILVTAGPGSGKTRVLTERIINLLSLNKKRVLALTFSNQAAEEIKNRIEQIFSDDEKKEQVYIGTIHSFCLEVVMNRGNLIGLPSGLTLFESEVDRISILKKAFIEMPDLIEILIKESDDKDFFRYCLKKISSYKQRFILPEVLIDSNIENDKNFAKLYEAFNNMMLQQRAIDFDDILLYAYRIFTERPQIANSYTRLYKFLLVDEAQDLNSSQYKIIKALCKDFSNIMMVGDPAQSIYGFNGSESDFMIKHFKNDFNPSTFHLTDNFRSTKKIIEVARKIQPSSVSNAVYPLKGELDVLGFDDEYLEAEWIIKKIDDLTKNGSKWIEGPVKYEDIVIIARNRYVFLKLSEKLDEINVPYYFGQSSRTVESESVFIKVFEAGLRVLSNPYDSVHFQQIINLLNLNSKDFSQDSDNYFELLIEIEKFIDNDYIKEKYKIVKKAWEILQINEENFVKSLDFLSEKLSFSEGEYSELQEKDLSEHYFIQKDIEMWKDNWRNYCGNTITGQRTLSHFRNQVSLGRTQSTNDNGLALLTVHMSKGLEYNVVFLMGLNEGTFPDYRAKGNKEYREELNNMFVALTRAKRICYITYSRSKQMPWGAIKSQKPSSFIKEIEL